MQRDSRNALPTRRDRNVSVEGNTCGIESRDNDNVHGVTGLPTHTAIRASHFEFQQALCSGQDRKEGSLRIRCPRLIFQMSKDRGHEAILLILDVAAIFRASTAVHGSWREIFSFFRLLPSYLPPRKLRNVLSVLRFVSRIEVTSKYFS